MRNGEPLVNIDENRLSGLDLNKLDVIQSKIDPSRERDIQTENAANMSSDDDEYDDAYDDEYNYEYSDDEGETNMSQDAPMKAAERTYSHRLYSKQSLLTHTHTRMAGSSRLFRLSTTRTRRRNCPSH